MIPELLKSTAGSRARSVWPIAFLLLLIPTAMSLSACEDKDIRAIATNTDRVALLIKDGREIRDLLVDQGTISLEEGRKITLGINRLNGALKAFNNRAKTYQAAGALTPEGKALLKRLANDIASAATDLVSDGTFGVKSPDAQARINTAIGAIKQVALAIVDTVDLLKTKSAPPPVQQTAPLGVATLLLAALRQIMEFVARERARTGKTTAEVFEDAGHQIDENEIALLEDLTGKYAPPSDPPDGPLPA